MRELAALGVHFYPPEMLLRRAEKIGLTPDQVTKIRQEMLGMRGHAVDLLAKIEHAKIEVTRLLSGEKLDEHAVDAQIDEAAKAEAEMHKLHLGALLRVRALLTPEQRQKLEERKHKRESQKPGTSDDGQTPGPSEPDDDDDDDDVWDEMAAGCVDTQSLKRGVCEGARPNVATAAIEIPLDVVADGTRQGKPPR
jgi:Spy/CpxP family protein refolding chaperone